MLRIVIVCSHKVEGDILKRALTQSKFEVKLFEPSLNNHLQFVQYKPDAIMTEMTKDYMDQIASVKLIKNAKQLKKIPILAYGNHTDDVILKSFKECGTRDYMARPLKIRPIFAYLEDCFKTRDIYEEANKAKEEKEQLKVEELIKLTDPAVLATDKLSIMTSHVDKLLAFPFTVVRVTSVTADAGSGAVDLAKVINQDSAVSASILKVSNSVTFSSGGKRIADIKDAVVRIGFNEVKNIALSLGVLNIADAKADHFGFNLTQFWLHSLSCGVIAEKLAKQSGFPNPSVAFLTGLLMDFGIMLYDAFFQDIFQKVLEKSSGDGKAFLKAEMDILQVQHFEFLAALFEIWKLPKEMIQAVEMQGKGFDSPEHSDESKALAKILHVAHGISKSVRHGRVCDEVVGPIPNEILLELKLSVGVKPAFFDSVNRDIELYRMFMSLENDKGVTDPLKIADQVANIAVIDPGKELFTPLVTFLEIKENPVQRYPTPESIPTQLAKAVPSLVIFNATTESTAEDVSKWKEDLMGQIKETESPPENVFWLVIAPEGHALASGDSEKQKHISSTIDLCTFEEVLQILIDS